jgi:hypothetical protein
VLRLVLTAVFVVGVLAYLVTRARQQAVSRVGGARRMVRTTGTVMSLHTGIVDVRGFQPDQTPLDFPVVRFQDASGTPVTFQSPRGWTRAPKVGRTVTVAYDPDDPQNARLDGHEWRSFNVAATIALVLVVVIVVIGLAIAAFLYRLAHS